MPSLSVPPWKRIYPVSGTKGVAGVSGRGTNKRKKKEVRSEDEEGISRWYFSDEDLQEAIRNIVDVVPVGPTESVRERLKRVQDELAKERETEDI